MSQCGRVISHISVQKEEEEEEKKRSSLPWRTREMLCCPRRDGEWNQNSLFFGFLQQNGVSKEILYGRDQNSLCLLDLVSTKFLLLLFFFPRRGIDGNCNNLFVRFGYRQVVKKKYRWRSKSPLPPPCLPICVRGSLMYLTLHCQVRQTCLMPSCLRRYSRVDGNSLFAYVLFLIYLFYFFIFLFFHAQPHSVHSASRPYHQRSTTGRCQIW